MATNMKTLNGYGFDASALGGYDPSHYATTEDIQQVRNEIPTELPNPNALTINGQSYDGSAPVSVEIPVGGGSGSYTLPIASPTTLGGVKVGNGLAIDENGVLSLNVSNASGVSF